MGLRLELTTSSKEAGLKVSVLIYQIDDGSCFDSASLYTTSQSSTFEPQREKKNKQPAKDERLARPISLITFRSRDGDNRRENKSLISASTFCDEHEGAADFPVKKSDSLLITASSMCGCPKRRKMARAHERGRQVFVFLLLDSHQTTTHHSPAVFSKISPSLISPSKNGKRNGLEYRTRLGQKYFQKFHQTLTSESGRRPLPRNFGFETNCST